VQTETEKAGTSSIHSATVLGSWEVESEEWLEARRQGIGASDVASILEVEGAYLTPLQVWAQKRGILQQDEEDRRRSSEILRWGKRLEPFIAEALQDATGYKVILTNETLAHPQYPFLRANLDAFAFCNTRGYGAAEFKNVGGYNAKDWKEETPLKFQVQLQAQLLVTGLPWGVIGGLIGGNSFVYSEMERNDAFISAMLPKLIEFWKMVETGEAPRATGRDTKLLAKLHSGTGDTEVGLPAEAHEIDQRLKEAKENISLWESVKKQAEAEIWQLLGDAALGVMPGGGGYKVVTVKKDGYVVEPFSYKYLKRVK